MDFTEIFGKNVTYDDIKSDTKTKLWLSSGSLFFKIYS